MADGSYDFVIVGGGTAGLVLANRLSENSDISVLVLEAGEDSSNDPRVMTPGFWPTLLNTPMDWAFRTTSQSELEGRSASFPQGRMLGGTSALNGMMLVGPAKTTINAWEELGNPGWAWSTFQKYLEASFSLAAPSDRVAQNLDISYLRESETLGGSSGPVQASFPEDSEDIWPSLWIKTLQGLGFPRCGHLFDGELRGVFTNAETINASTRQRSYSYDGYLRPALGRGNLSILTGALASRIVFDTSPADDAPIATGVEYTHQGVKKYVSASRNVLLTAGSFNSPKLLEMSGVGNSGFFSTLGINTIVDNPHVGENLQNHLMCAVNLQARDDLPTKDMLMRQDPEQLAAAAKAYQSLSGPFASAGTIASAQIPLPGSRTAEGREKIESLFDSICSNSHTSNGSQTFAKAHEEFVRSITLSPTDASALYISIPVDTGARDPVTVADAKSQNGNEKFFTINVLLGHPLSRGSVHVTAPEEGSTDFGLAIDPKYLSHPLDIEVLARHIQFIETIAATEPLASHLKVDGVRSVKGLRDLEKAKDYVRKTASGAHHATGTCSMMPRDMGGVVDPRLRVYGCQNLRVCDASIIPLTMGTSPQATVYTIAEIAASIIKADCMA